MGSQFYSEIRPAYVQEADYVCTILIAGTGSIDGWLFEAELVTPDGSVVVDGASAVVLNPTDRTATLTLAGQTSPGEFRWSVRRTDEGKGSVVALGTIEITDPTM